MTAVRVDGPGTLNVSVWRFQAGDSRPGVLARQPHKAGI
jgi:hypothetical protein